MKTGIAIAMQREKLDMSQDELAKAVGVSKATVSRWESGDISNMRRDRIQKLAAALHVSPLALLTEETEFEHFSAAPTEPLSNIEPVAPPVEMRRVPVIGEVAAGFQSLADMLVIDYVSCDAALLHSGYDYVYLRVHGDSMEPELHEGDLVLVRVQDTVESGDYAVVLVDGETGLVKRIEIDSTHITLLSENPYYPPRKFEKSEMNRIRIFGKVIGSQRRYG